MIPVSQGKPYAGNPHVRFEEGASAQAAPRRSALLHNGPYFEMKIENVPFESCQEKKSPIRRKYDTIIVFPNGR
jgi:hypothetical protein